MTIEIDLSQKERIFYRDLLRSARYQALANAEGFEEICFAVEALGLRLIKKEGDLGQYENSIERLSRDSIHLAYLPIEHPGLFLSFLTLYTTLRKARNDAMHTGVYARNATQKAVDLCIGLEEALMSGAENSISNYMVHSPITAEPWHPVAHIRKLMLLHSISYIPIFEREEWLLISEAALLRYLGVRKSSTSGNRKTKLGKPVSQAEELERIPANTVTPTTTLEEAIESMSHESYTKLWLVIDNENQKNLIGVFTPFDLL